MKAILLKIKSLFGGKKDLKKVNLSVNKEETSPSYEQNFVQWWLASKDHKEDLNMLTSKQAEKLLEHLSFMISDNEKCRNYASNVSYQNQLENENCHLESLKQMLKEHFEI